MRETMPADGEVDAAASYRDPRAVPLRDAAKLLDLDYSKIFDDTDQDELLTHHVESGRYRIIAYEKPRRLSDEPVLVEIRFVKAAFQELRCGQVFDPVHDRLLSRPTVVGEPSRRMLAIPAMAAEYREMQRLMALPPAIDWSGCAIRVGRYAFVNCKAIRAEDLSRREPEPEVETAPQRTGPPRGKRQAPNDARGRLRKMIKAVPNASALKAWEVADKIVAAHPEVVHTDRGGLVVNPDGWWAWGTLRLYVSTDKDRNR